MMGNSAGHNGTTFCRCSLERRLAFTL